MRRRGFRLYYRTKTFAQCRLSPSGWIPALAKRPGLLVLDEPVASLDPLARRDFMRTLVDAAAERELTVLLSSHGVAELERVCDHLVLLDNGRAHRDRPGDARRV